MKTTLSSHVLDLQTGMPAVGLKVSLFEADAKNPLDFELTNEDGRVSSWNAAINIWAGEYRLEFETGEWAKSLERESFYPKVVIYFSVEEGQPHYHVPLLLSPYGYSTYRGS